MVLNVTNQCNLSCTYCYEYGDDKIVDTENGRKPKFMSEETAQRQDIRPLQIGLLNLMPKKVQTETQFARVIGTTPLQIELTLIRMSEHQSKHTSAAHLEAFYQPFREARHRRFDGLIITGAPIEHLDFEAVSYWNELREVFDWTQTNVHSTMGGQGMNCCMQDAFNLGWKLALVLKGHARSDLLDTYEAERRPVAEQVIWAASSLHDIFMTHGKDIAQRKQTMFDPGYTEKVVNSCSGVSYTYRDYVQKPAALTELSGPAIGDRAPDIDFEQGGTLFDRMRHEYFTLLVMPGHRFPSPVVESLQRQFSPVLAVETLPASDALSKRYGTGDGRLFLVRPDGYIGFKCAANEVPLLEASLQGLLRN